MGVFTLSPVIFWLFAISFSCAFCVLMSRWSPNNPTFFVCRSRSLMMMASSRPTLNSMPFLAIVCISDTLSTSPGYSYDGRGFLGFCDAHSAIILPSVGAVIIIVSP